MFLRGPVPVHLKSVVAYHKNLKVSVNSFLAQSRAGSFHGGKLNQTKLDFTFDVITHKNDFNYVISSL